MKLCTNKMSKVVLSLVFSLAMLVAFCVASTVFADDAPVFNTDNVKPGLNIFTGAKTAQTPTVDGNPFANWNTTKGSISGGYVWEGGTADGTDGIYTTFTTPINRKALIAVAMYREMYVTIKTASEGTTAEGTARHIGWHTEDVVKAHTTTFENLEEIYFLPLYRGNHLYGISVIPYYKAIYHIGDATQEVEFLLDEGTTLTYEKGWGGEINGLPTEYVPVTPEGYTVPAGYNLLGWSTEPDATVAMETVALANEDIDLYPVLVEDVPVFNTDNVKPGLNIFTGAKTAQTPTVDGNPFGRWNNTTGYIEGGYHYVGTTDDGTSGIYTTFTTPIDRKSAVVVATYSNVYIRVKTSAAEDAPRFHVGWHEDGVVKAMAIELEAGMSELYLLPLYRHNHLYGISVIPYYHINYHGDTVETVEYLGDINAISYSAGWGKEILGLPTEYTPDASITAEAPAGYKFVGWSTTEGGAVVDTVALANEDIDLYPVFVEDKPVFNTDNVKPGLNIFTGAATSQKPTVDGNPFGRWNNTTGSISGGYMYEGTTSDGSSGIYTTFTTPIDRKVAVTAAYYSGMNVAVRTAPDGTTAEGTLQYLGWYPSGGDTKAFTKTFNAGMSAVYFAPMERKNNLFHVSVIPYYHINYHGDTVETVEYLGDVSAISYSKIYGGDIQGLPTEYTVDTAKVATAPEGYEFKGWSTTEGGAIVDTVALANEDIDLYPVFEEVETPVEPPVEPEEPAAFADTQAFVIAGEETKELAILTAINGAEYDAVGLVIAADGNAENGTPFEANTVYTSVVAGEDTYAAEALGGEFISAFVIKGMPDDGKVRKTYAIPYVVLDGATIYGAAVEIIVE